MSGVEGEGRGCGVALLIFGAIRIAPLHDGLWEKLVCGAF